MRILVGEDDTVLASFVRKGLEAEHYAVDVSADGEQARIMAGELDFDLVMLDPNLPRMDRVEILRFLRTRKPSMPTLVQTGRNRVDDRVRCLDLGADDYLGTFLVYRTIGAHQGPDAAQSYAGGVGCWRLTILNLTGWNGGRNAPGSRRAR